MNRITTIGGNGKNAAAISLSRMLKKNDTNWVVLDYTGRLSLVLQGLPGNELKRDLVTWIDLANRNCPRGIFQLWSSKNLDQALYNSFRYLRSVSRFMISDSALGWLTEVGLELSKNGKITLGTLLTSLSRPDLCSWFRDRCPDSDELHIIQKMLTWCLQFPAVYSFSEGGYSKQEKLWLENRRKITWFEMLREHFEHSEHHILSSLLMNFISFWTKEKIIPELANSRKMTTMIHGFPPTFLLKDMSSWVEETRDYIKHICVTNIYPNQAPKEDLVHWLNRSAEIWLTPFSEKLCYPDHCTWLTEEECNVINNLKKGYLFLKDKNSSKHLVAKGLDCSKLPITHQYRQHSRTIGISKHPVHLRTVNSPSLVRRLYDTVCKIESLQLAWLKIRKGNKRTCGIDGISVVDFEREKDRHLAVLSSELRKKTYMPRPLRRHKIPKADGSSREIGVFCVRDKIVQTACQAVLEPFFEQGFSNSSFAFRPGRNAHQAIILAATYFNDGCRWVVCTDIQKCFDTIDRQLLLEMVENKIGDGELLALIDQWLEIDVIEFNEIIPVLTGVPQGSVLSPLLANIYLDPLDKYLEKSGYLFTRYADDINIYTHDHISAQTALQKLEGFLQENLHLSLKPVKTSIKRITDGFDFLGFSFCGNAIEIARKKDREIKAGLGERVRLLGKSRDMKSIFEAMQQLNSFIRGIRNYFVLPLPEYREEQMMRLDAMVKELGTKHLSDQLQKESIWHLREQFYIPDVVKDDLSAQAHEADRLASSGYPVEKEENFCIELNQGRDTHHKENTKKSEGDVNETEEEPSIFITDDGQAHIFRHGSVLTYDDEFILLRKNRKDIWKGRITEFSAFFLQGKGNSITTRLHLELSNHNIPLFLMSDSGKVVAVAGLQNRKDKLKLRSLQAIRHNDIVIISAGLSMLAAKTGNQASLLKYFAKYRKKAAPEIAGTLSEAADKISEHAGSLIELDPCNPLIRKTAMGVEGMAASVYWQAAAKLVPDPFEFTSRKTRGAKDVINQCLNYSYGLLYGEVWQKVYGFGLDPCFGIMHSSIRDMGSLVFDLIEEFRVPFSDRLIFSLMGRGFNPEVGKDDRLTLRTRKTILSGFQKRWGRKFKWRSRSVCPAEILHSQVGDVVNLFLDNKKYKPYRMKW